MELWVERLHRSRITRVKMRKLPSPFGGPNPNAMKVQTDGRVQITPDEHRQIPIQF
jgi:hypothetical protein